MCLCFCVLVCVCGCVCECLCVCASDWRKAQHLWPEFWAMPGGFSWHQLQPFGGVMLKGGGRCHERDPGLLGLGFYAGLDLHI